MGVRGLLSYLYPIRRQVSDASMRGANIGLDAMYLLYFFRTNTKRFEEYVQQLLELQCKLIFVMDGKAEEEKKETVEKRKKERAEAASDVERIKKQLEDPSLDEEEKASLTRRLKVKEHDAWQLNPSHKKWFTSMILEKGCTIIYAPKEADSILASSVYDAVISSDTDILVLGCEKMWIPMYDGSLVKHMEYTAEDMWKILGLDTRQQLFELAFLVGCDVQPRPILPFDKALSWLRFYGSLFVIHIRYPEILSEEMLKKFVALCRGVWDC